MAFYAGLGGGSCGVHHTHCHIQCEITLYVISHSAPGGSGGRVDILISDAAVGHTCTLGTIFVPFALETYGALSSRSDCFLVECAAFASRECAGSVPSMSLLGTWFRQRVSIASQRSLAHVIHAIGLRLEKSIVLLPPPPPRVPLSSFCC